MSHESTFKSRLVSLLKERSLRTGSFTLASGKSSHYYVDGRNVTLAADGAALIGEAVLDELSRLGRVAAVGGLTMGADPIVGATLAAAGRGDRPDLAGFLVRKAAKSSRDRPACRRARPYRDGRRRSSKT